MAVLLDYLRHWWKENVPPFPKWRGWVGQIECEVKHQERKRK